MLTAAYGDERIDDGNRRALALLREARPMIVGAGAARDLIPGLEGRTVLHAGPPVEWELRCARSATPSAERWCSRAGRLPAEAAPMVARGDVRVATAHSLSAAGAMSRGDLALHGVLGRPRRGGRRGGLQPVQRRPRRGVLAGGGVPRGHPPPADDGRGGGARIRGGAARGRTHRRVRPLRAGHRDGRRLPHAPPGDDHAAAAPGVPSLAERAPRTVLPTARLGRQRPLRPDDDDRRGPGRLAGIQGTPASSLVVFISRNGTDAAVQIAGLPDRWFPAPAPMVGDPLYRPGFSDADAAPDIGDSALVECCGLGAAASAASPARGRLPGRGRRRRRGANARDGRHLHRHQRAAADAALDGEGTPLGVDARACVDIGGTPLINTGILHRADGGQIGAGIARTPLEPIRDALAALVHDLAT